MWVATNVADLQLSVMKPTEAHGGPKVARLFLMPSGTPDASIGQFDTMDRD
jgi:hypothetical protein